MNEALLKEINFTYTGLLSRVIYSDAVTHVLVMMGTIFSAQVNVVLLVEISAPDR
jgi:hypothetical protein